MSENRETAAPGAFSIHDMTNARFFIEHASTPTGAMRIVTDAEGRLRALDWDDHETA